MISLISYIDTDALESVGVAEPHHHLLMFSIAIAIVNYHELSALLSIR